MDDIRLLRFRWGNKEYGIPAEDVIGITKWTWVNLLENPQDIHNNSNLQGKPINIVCLQGGFKHGEDKQAIILDANGVEILLIVDEVITSSRLTDEVVVGVTRPSFKIWQF